MSFANPQMRQIKFINMLVARSVAVVANLSLAWLVARHTRKPLQPYKRILSLTIFIDISVSIIVVLFQTTAIQSNGIYFNLLDEISLGYHLPLNVALIGTTVVTFFVYSAVSILPLHYIYRYLVICHNYRINYWYLAGLCFICALFPSYMMIGRIIRLWPDDRMDYYGTVLYNSNRWLFTEGAEVRFLASPTDRYSQNALIPASFYAVVYGIIIYCSMAVIIRLREMRPNMSSKTLQLQSQMNKILFVQAIIPLFTTVIPMVLNNLSQMLQTPIFPQSDIPVWFLTVWSSAINPICTITIMSSYRRVLSRFFSPNPPSKVSVVPKTTLPPAFTISN